MQHVLDGISDFFIPNSQKKLSPSTQERPTVNIEKKKYKNDSKNPKMDAESPKTDSQRLYMDILKPFFSKFWKKKFYGKRWRPL